MTRTRWAVALFGLLALMAGAAFRLLPTWRDLAVIADHPSTLDWGGVRVVAPAGYFLAPNASEALLAVLPLDSATDVTIGLQATPDDASGPYQELLNKCSDTAACSVVLGDTTTEVDALTCLAGRKPSHTLAACQTPRIAIQAYFLGPDSSLADFLSFASRTLLPDPSAAAQGPGPSSDRKAHDR